MKATQSNCESPVRPYRRILSFVDISPTAVAVVRRATQVARFYSASFAVASVVDYPPGLECDHVPFLTPGEFRVALIRDVTEKIQAIVSEADCHGAELIIAEGREKDVKTDIIASWKPDLVVIAEYAWHPANAHGAARSSFSQRHFDLLTVQSDRSGLAVRVGRFIQALGFGV